MKAVVLEDKTLKDHKIIEVKILLTAATDPEVLAWYTSALATIDTARLAKFAQDNFCVFISLAKSEDQEAQGKS